VSEPCTHERGDHDYPAAIGSFVVQTRALTAMTAERDAALAALARVRAVAVSLEPTMTKMLQGDWEYASSIASAKILTALEPTPRTTEPKGTR
jgi:hypothetical protein